MKDFIKQSLIFLIEILKLNESESIIESLVEILENLCSLKISPNGLQNLWQVIFIVVKRPQLNESLEKAIINLVQQTANKLHSLQDKNTKYLESNGHGGVSLSPFDFRGTKEFEQDEEKNTVQKNTL